MSSTNVSSDSESDSEVEDLKSSHKRSESTDNLANNESSSEEEDSSEDDDEDDDERRTTGGIGPTSNIPKQNNGEESEEDEEGEDEDSKGLGTDVFALIEEYSKRKRFDENEGEGEGEFLQEQNEEENNITKKVKTSSALLYLDPTEQNPFLINKSNRNWKKPDIANVTPSEALERVKAFLPQFAAANTILQQKIEAGEGDQHQINLEKQEEEDDNEDENEDAGENGKVEIQSENGEGDLNLIESIGNFEENEPVNLNEVEQYIEMNLGLFEDTDFNESTEVEQDMEQQEQENFMDNNSNVTLIRLAQNSLTLPCTAFYHHKSTIIEPNHELNGFNLILTFIKS